VQTVSAIIPTFNRAHLIGAAIESALGQTCPPQEIIVVDDGSTDDTARVLAPYRDRVRYVVQPNQGPAAARNHGFRLARGDFIALLDSDDLWLPDRLARQQALLVREPRLDVLFGRELVFAEGQPERDWNLHDPEVRRRLGTTDGPLEDATALLVRENFLPTSSTLFRRSLLEGAGAINPRFRQAEDHDFWLRLALAGARFGYVPAPLCRRRMHADNLIHDWFARTLATAQVLEQHAAQLEPWQTELRARLGALHYDLGSRFLYARDFRAARQHLAAARRRGRTDFRLALKQVAARLGAWLQPSPS
jgi:glycosyltransferase involved in cell wall biosynthesis